MAFGALRARLRGDGTVKSRAELRLTAIPLAVWMTDAALKELSRF